MNPLKELLSTLSKRPTTSGTVSNVLSTTQVLVSTPTGAVACRLGINTPLRVGDKVAIAGDTVVSKLVADTEIPQYVV